jgi:hypothetical protein
MKKFLLLLPLFTASAFSQTPNFLWATKLGSENDSYSSSIKMDLLGNIYVTGQLSINGEYPDIFILKLDAGNNIIWLKSVTGTSNNHSNDITTDLWGNVYITGNFSGTADFDPGVGTYNLTSAGINDIFILKLDALGNFIWAKNIGWTGDDYGNSIVTDALGNVFTTGFFHDTVDFDPGPGVFNLNGGINYNIFISKLDASGNFIWAKSIGGMFGGVGNSISLDASGNIFTTGYFTGTVDFDPGSSAFNLTSNGSDNLFISKLDSNGNFVFVKTIEAISINFFTTLDANGNLYTIGNFAGMVDFDPGPGTAYLTSLGNDMFILKLDHSGNFVWAKAMGGIGSNTNGKSLVVDVFKNIYITGSFFGITDFDPGAGIFNLNSIGGNDIFISKLDSLGDFLWTTSIGSSGWDEKGTSIVVDTFSGNVGITGVFNSHDIYFGNILLHNSNHQLITYDIFIAKLNIATAVEGINNTINITVYPNPSNENITITTNREKGELILYDFLGKQVIQKKTEDEQQTTVDVSFLRTGIYLLQFKTDQGTYSKKFVKD